MKKILRSALAILVVSAMAATFSACGPEDMPADAPAETSAATIGSTGTASDDLQPMESSTVPAVTSAPETEEPAEAVTAPTQTSADVSAEATTVSTPAETEKTTEKTEKTEKKTEKTEKKTEKVTEASKDTEPEEGSRLPDDDGDEEIDLEWEDVNIDEWLEMMGVDGGGDDVPDIGVNE